MSATTATETLQTSVPRSTIEAQYSDKFPLILREDISSDFSTFLVRLVSRQLVTIVMQCGSREDVAAFTTSDDAVKLKILVASMIKALDRPVFVTTPAPSPYVVPMAMRSSIVLLVDDRVLAMCHLLSTPQMQNGAFILTHDSLQPMDATHVMQVVVRAVNSVPMTVSESLAAFVGDLDPRYALDNPDIRTALASSCADLMAWQHVILAEEQDAPFRILAMSTTYAGYMAYYVLRDNLPRAWIVARHATDVDHEVCARMLSRLVEPLRLMLVCRTFASPHTFLSSSASAAFMLDTMTRGTMVDIIGEEVRRTQSYDEFVAACEANKK